MLLNRRLSVLWAAAIMLLTVLLASGVALGITFGTDDGTKHPNVGALVSEDEGAYCTGTLVAGKNNGPPVFVTAAHCYPLEGNTSYVTFDPTYSTYNASTKYAGTWHEEKDSYLRGHDIAVVVFDKGDNPPNLNLEKLPTVNSLDTLTKGQKFTAVGYGVTSGTSDDSGTRRYSVSSFTSKNSYFLGLSQNQKQGNSGTCYGDSGGPNFFGAGTSETHINAALTNTGDAMCKSKNTVLRLDTQVAHDFLDDYVASDAFVPIPQP